MSGTVPHISAINFSAHLSLNKDRPGRKFDGKKILRYGVEREFQYFIAGQLLFAYQVAAV